MPETPPEPEATPPPQEELPPSEPAPQITLPTPVPPPPGTPSSPSAPADLPAVAVAAPEPVPDKAPEPAPEAVFVPLKDWKEKRLADIRSRDARARERARAPKVLPREVEGRVCLRRRWGGFRLRGVCEVRKGRFGGSIVRKVREKDGGKERKEVVVRTGVAPQKRVEVVVPPPREIDGAVDGTEGGGEFVVEEVGRDIPPSVVPSPPSDEDGLAGKEEVVDSQDVARDGDSRDDAPAVPKPEEDEADVDNLRVPEKGTGDGENEEGERKKLWERQSDGDSAAGLPTVVEESDSGTAKRGSSFLGEGRVGSIVSAIGDLLSSLPRGSSPDAPAVNPSTVGGVEGRLEVATTAGGNDSGVTDRSGAGDVNDDLTRRLSEGGAMGNFENSMATHQWQQLYGTRERPFNFASVDAGARVLAASGNAVGYRKTLNNNMDQYMLVPCAGDGVGGSRWIDIELSEEVVLTSFETANYEYYSSFASRVALLGATEYPPKKWNTLAVFDVASVRSIQRFKIPNRAVARYLRIIYAGKQGNEFYCPVSVIRAFGKTLIADWKDSLEGSGGSKAVDDDDSRIPHAPHSTASTSQKDFAGGLGRASSGPSDERQQETTIKSDKGTRPEVGHRDDGCRGKRGGQELSVNNLGGPADGSDPQKDAEAFIDGAGASGESKTSPLEDKVDLATVKHASKPAPTATTIATTFDSPKLVRDATRDAVIADGTATAKPGALPPLVGAGGVEDSDIVKKNDDDIQGGATGAIAVSSPNLVPPPTAAVPPWGAANLATNSAAFDEQLSEEEMALLKAVREEVLQPVSTEQNIFRKVTRMIRVLELNQSLTNQYIDTHLSQFALALRSVRFESVRAQQDAAVTRSSLTGLASSTQAGLDQISAASLKRDVLIGVLLVLVALLIGSHCVLWAALGSVAQLDSQRVNEAGVEDVTSANNGLQRPRNGTAMRKVVRLSEIEEIVSPTSGSKRSKKKKSSRGDKRPGGSIPLFPKSPTADSEGFDNGTASNGMPFTITSPNAGRSRSFLHNPFASDPPRSRGNISFSTNSFGVLTTEDDGSTDGGDRGSIMRSKSFGNVQ